jgi:hypothetical protein
MSTKEKAATAKVTKYSCEFCNRSFARESTIASHICEYKHRWLEKDKRGNQIGFQAWMQFYHTNTGSRKHNTYQEFIKSSYYTAFAKYGTFCVDINALNIQRFTEWLLKNQIKIDSWCSDQTYTRYLIEYLRHEDPMDALARSIETTIKKAEEEGVRSCDYLRYGNINKICYQLTLGKLSPWILYHSKSGSHFLETLNPEHVKMIIEYINPEQWALKFKRNPDDVEQVKQLLDQAGY